MIFYLFERERERNVLLSPLFLHEASHFETIEYKTVSIQFNHPTVQHMTWSLIGQLIGNRQEQGQYKCPLGHVWLNEPYHLGRCSSYLLQNLWHAIILAIGWCIDKDGLVP